MKKRYLFLSLVLWPLQFVCAQTQVDIRTQSKSIDLSGAAFTIPARTGTALPSTCSLGEFFFKSNAPPGQNIYGCAPANTWTVQTGASVASTTNLLAGDNLGNAIATSMSPSILVTLAGAQTLTNKSISSGQITGLAASATTDATNASNLNSGTLPAGRLPTPTTASLGGVQAATPVTHNFLTGISSAGLPSVAQPSVSDISGYVAPVSSDWSLASGLGQILHKPTALSAFTNDSSFITASALGSTPLTGDVTGTAASNAVSKINGAAVPPSVTCLGTNAAKQLVTGTCGGSTTIASVTDLIAGNGAGNGIDSGIAPSSVVTLTGAQTLTNKNIAASQITGVLGASAGGTGTASPSLVAGQNVTITGAWPNQTVAASATASSAFSGLTGSTNTTAAMTVGSGASLGAAGSGTIAATSVAPGGVPLAGDVTGTAATNTVSKVNGAAVPPSVTCLGTNASSQLVTGTCGSGGGSSIASVTNLIAGNGSGNGVDSGISPSSVVTLTGTQTLTNKNIAASQVTGVLGTGAGGTGTASPSLVAGQNVTVSGTWPNQTITASATASSAFSGLTGSTNTTAAMVVGNGASLAATGTGTIAATSVPASGVTGVLPVANGGTGTTNGAAVQSVAGRTGAITLSTSDISGLGSAATQASSAFDASGAAATVQAVSLQKASNLSDVASPSTARTNLGLTGAATATLPLSVANGGTGNTAASLTAGSNVSITGTWPSQKVALTGLATSATTDTTNAANISAGTLPAARLPAPTASTLGGTQSLAPVSHNFLTGISTSGVPSAAQPAFSDLSGVLSVTSGGTGTANPSLVAGSNVTITGTWPNQTVSAAASGGSGSGLNPPSSGAGMLKGATSSFSTSVATPGVDFQSPVSLSAANYGDGATNGIQSAIAQCGTSVSCSVVAPPTYGASENRPCVWSLAAYTTNGCSYAMSPNVTFFDYRNGIYAQNVDSGGLYPTSNYQAWQRSDFVTTAPMVLNNSNLYFASKVASNVNLLALGGGVNVNTATYPNKSFYVGQDTRVLGYTPGQKIGYQTFMNSYAVGDSLGFYGLDFCFGGFNAGSDEGCEAMDIQASQGNIEYTGTVTGSSANTVSVAVSAGDGTQGEGRFLIDTSQGYSTGTISAIGTTGPITLTGAGTAWPVSTVNTTTSTVVNTPGAATVTVGSVAGISTSTTLCVADQYNLEQVIPTAVSGSTFTANFRYPHTTGAIVAAGGMACHFMVLTADIATPAAFPTLTFALQNSLHWAVPIIRSTSATTLDLWMQSPNAGWSGYRGRWTASNNGYTIYPGAQVTSVMQNQKLSGTLTLEVPVNFASGDGVALPLYHNLNVYEALHAVQRVFPQVGGANPAAWWMTLNGLWTDTDTAMEVDNNTPASIYAGGKARPLFMHPKGSWDSVLYLDSQPSNVIRSEDTTAATNIVLQSSNSGYAYLASDPLNHRWTMGNYFSGATIYFDWVAGNIQTTGKVSAAGYVAPQIQTGVLANSDLAGFIGLSSGTGTYSFTGGYTNPPVCTANDNTSVAPVRVQTSNTTLTVTGTGSDTVSYVCVARY